MVACGYDLHLKGFLKGLVTMKKAMTGRSGMRSESSMCRTGPWRDTGRRRRRCHDFTSLPSKFSTEIVVFLFFLMSSCD